MHANERWMKAWRGLTAFFIRLRPNRDTAAELPLRVSRAEFFARFLADFPEHEEFRAELAECYKSFSQFSVRPNLWAPR
jgi:hypothetical protein